MTTSSSARFLIDGLSDDIEDLGTWPNLLNVAFGLGLLAAGIVFGGQLLERVDTVAIGSLIGLISAYNLYRISQGNLEHPDIPRGTALLGLWLIGFSLSKDTAPLKLLTDVSLVLGAFILIVNLADFVRQFKNRPGKRRWARNHGPTVIDFGTNIGGTLYQQIQSDLNSIMKLLSQDVGHLTGPILPLLLAIPVGIGAGIGAAAFRVLMYGIHTILFTKVLPLLPSHLWIVLLPVVGAGVAGVLIYEFAPEAAGHGVPENMEAIADNGGKIRHRLAPFKVVVSALTLGSGGSGGREGPIARIGAGVGSSLSQLFDLSAENTRLLLAAGIAGGIGATFGAPIGGIFFGLEIVIVYRIKLYNILVLALSNLVAVATGEFIAPHFTWFAFMPFPLPELAVSPSDVVFAIPYGIVMGVVAWTWVVVLDRTERGFNDFSVPEHVKPLLGAIPVGILGIWYAKYGVMGVGYKGLRFAVSDVKVGALLLIILAGAKLVATQFTIGSGGSGGVFAPTLYIGGLFAVGVHQFVGVLPVSSALVGVVGMAAIFSGAAFAPLTAIFLVAEVFDAYALIAVLAVPCLISYGLSRAMLNASIYTARLQRKGILDGYPNQAEQIGPSTGGGTPQDDEDATVRGRSSEQSTD